jgi:hypothetical protein
MGQVHLVVLQQNNTSCELGIGRELVNPLHDSLAVFVSRVGFASKYYLYRLPFVVDYSPQAVGVEENQISPLVCGEPSSETDGEGFRVQQRTGSRQMTGLPPVASRRFTDVLKQPAFEPGVHIP